MKTNKTPDLLTMAIANLERVAEQCDRTTSGNVSHQIATIKGIAGRTAAYLKKHTSGDAKTEIQEAAIEAYRQCCPFLQSDGIKCLRSPLVANECIIKEPYCKLITLYIQKLNELQTK